EQRVVADVSPDVDLMLRTEVGRVDIPRSLRLQHHVDDRLEPRHARPPRKEILDADEASEEIAQIGRRRVAREREIVETRTDRRIEKAPKPHPPLSTANNPKPRPPPAKAACAVFLMRHDYTAIVPR